MKYIHIILRTEAEDGWRTRGKNSSRRKGVGVQGLGGCCASVLGCPLVHHEAALISVRTRMKVEVDSLVIEGDATSVLTKVLQYSGVVTGDGRSCTAVLQRRTTRLWWMNGETRPIVPAYTRIDADVNSPLK